jgi:hypothetical protein
MGPAATVGLVLPRRAAAVVAVAVLAACQPGRSAPRADPTAPTAPATVTTSATTAATTAAGPNALRTLDLGTVPAHGTRATLQVPPGTASFLFSAVSTDLDADLSIADVVGPSGQSAVPEASLLDNPAEVSVLVSAPGGLPPGGYEVLLETKVPLTASAVLKPTTTVAHQVLDVRIWDATKKGRATTAAGRRTAERAVRSRAEMVFAPVDLGIGAIDISRAPASVITSSARLRLPSTGTERRLRELCRAMAAALGPARALDLVFVDEILDRTAKDTELFGAAAAVPGATMVPGASTSCAAVAIGGDGGVAAQATTVWHEAGHLLGLFHTSEEDGTEWDPIDDTPRCTADEDADDDGYLDEAECEARDGHNLMFHDTNRTDLTPGQAAVLRSHPLFHD